jgi:hypothetical protein
MTSSEKPAYWQQHFNDWKQSGLSQREYCRQHQLAVSSFGYWRKRLKNHNRPCSKLVPVSIAGTSTIIISLPSGIRIEAPLHSLSDVLLAVAP